MIKLAKSALMLIVLLTFSAFSSGCLGRVIAEDEVRTDLQQIDPADGVEKEIDVTLYYRLTNEKYLVGVNRTVSARGGERTETAVIRTLIEGVPLMANDVSPLFASETAVLDTSYESGILYVTLSEDFLDDAMVSSVRREDYLNAENYEKALNEAYSEMYLCRRLAVLSIVNTIAGISEDVKVQVMVDSSGNGQGQRLPYSVMGFEGYSGDEIMEPIGFSDDVIASPQNIASCFFEHMVHGEYEMAYVLVAETDRSGVTKPTYADFETEMMSFGTIQSYEVTGTYIDDLGLNAVADVRIAFPEGTVKLVSNAKISLEDEGDLHKVGYGSLKALMES